MWLCWNTQRRALLLCAELQPNILAFTAGGIVNWVHCGGGALHNFCVRERPYISCDLLPKDRANSISCWASDVLCGSFGAADREACDRFNGSHLCRKQNVECSLTWLKGRLEHLMQILKMFRGSALSVEDLNRGATVAYSCLLATHLDAKRYARQMQ